MLIELSIFELYVIILVGSILAATVAGVVSIKIIQNRREAKKRRLRKPRNSLQKYPSFVENKITGQIAILPMENYCGKDIHPLMSQQYLIAIGPPIDFYTSSLSCFDRMYPGRAVRQEEDDETCKSCSKKDLEQDQNNNVIFFL